MKQLLAHRWLGDLAALLALVGIWVVACWPWLTGQAMIGWDNLDYVFPLIRFFADSFARGELPFWNPFSFGGMTVLADPQGMLFTPHALAALVLRDRYGIRANDVTTLLTVLPGAAAIYLLARREAAAGRLWPLLGALVFLLGGAATSRLQHVPQVVTYALLPIILLAVQQVCRTPRWWLAPPLATLLAVLLLGMNQVALLGIYMLAPLALLELWRSTQRNRALAIFAVAGLAAAVLTLPVILAMFEALATSNRAIAMLSEIQAGAFDRHSLPPFTLIGLWLSGLFGYSTWPAAPFWTPTDPSQDQLHIGAVAIVALLAALLFAGRRDGRLVLVLALLTAAALFTLGTNTPLYRLMVDQAPGFAFSRRPADGSYLMNMFAALAVGAGGVMLARAAGAVSWYRRAWQAAVLLSVVGAILLLAAPLHDFAAASGREADLRTAWTWAAWRLGMALSLVLAWLWFRNRSWRLLPALGLVAMAITELLSAGRFAIMTAVPDRFVEQAALYRWPSAWRVLDHPWSAAFRFLDEGGAVGQAAEYRVEVIGGPMATSGPLAFGVRNAQGYSPLRLQPYAGIFGDQPTTLPGRRFPTPAPNYASQLVTAQGLRWVLLHRPSTAQETPLPEGFLSPRAIETMLEATPGAARIAAFGSYDAWRLPAPGPRVQLLGVAGACILQEAHPDRMTIGCEAEAPAFLALNDAFAPGWQACANGFAAPITVWAGAFRQVPVPAGASVIVMRYRPLPGWPDTCGPK